VYVLRTVRSSRTIRRGTNDRRRRRVRIVCFRWEHHPSKRRKLAGIIGTLGKERSAIKEAHCLGRADHARLAMPGGEIVRPSEAHRRLSVSLPQRRSVTLPPLLIPRVLVWERTSFLLVRASEKDVGISRGCIVPPCSPDPQRKILS